jgi:NADH-quinone oxidoreductase subunit J
MVLAYLVVSGCIVFGAVAAVLLKNLLRSAIALGFGSAALAALFFMLEAPYAGGFELSVGAGLISVLFIIVISLAESPRRQPRDP